MVMGAPFRGPPAAAARAAFGPTGFGVSSGRGDPTPRSRHHDHTHFIGQNLPVHDMTTMSVAAPRRVLPHRRDRLPPREIVDSALDARCCAHEATAVIDRG